MLDDLNKLISKYEENELAIEQLEVMIECHEDIEIKNTLNLAIARIRATMKQIFNSYNELTLTSKHKRS